MKRREFITLLGGAAAWPMAARGQQGVPGGRVREWTVARLRRLSGGRLPSGLARQRFYREPEVALGPRWADGRGGRLPALTAELIERKVAVLFARCSGCRGRCLAGGVGSNSGRRCYQQRSS